MTKNFHASFTFFIESFILNEIWEVEKFPFQQLHSRKTQICSELNLDKVSVFGLCLWLYNEALIDQLVGSIRENIQTLAFRTDLTSFGPYFKNSVRSSKIRSEYFPGWISQLVNKIILWYGNWYGLAFSQFDWFTYNTLLYSQIKTSALIG